MNKPAHPHNCGVKPPSKTVCREFSIPILTHNKYKISNIIKIWNDIVKEHQNNGDNIEEDSGHITSDYDNNLYIKYNVISDNIEYDLELAEYNNKIKQFEIDMAVYQAFIEKYNRASEAEKLQLNIDKAELQLKNKQKNLP